MTDLSTLPTAQLYEQLRGPIERLHADGLDEAAALVAEAADRLYALRWRRLDIDGPPGEVGDDDDHEQYEFWDGERCRSTNPAFLRSRTAVERYGITWYRKRTPPPTNPNTR